jgi:hypothetical protein
VLVVVNFGMKFTYVLAGWEESVHDATILADSLETFDGLKVPVGKFYLADVGYACHSGFLPQGTTLISSLQGSTLRMPRDSSISNILALGSPSRGHLQL